LEAVFDLSMDSMNFYHLCKQKIIHLFFYPKKLFLYQGHNFSYFIYLVKANDFILDFKADFHCCFSPFETDRF